jgi:hypothetical protein
VMLAILLFIVKDPRKTPRPNPLPLALSGSGDEAGRGD